MSFSNAINSSNVHFQNTSGTLEVADRLRVSTTGTTFNLGITYAAGTLSVTGSDGTALSSTNPTYVTLQDRSSPGLNKIFTVTANQTFIDDAGASTIIGNLFGLGTGVAVTVDIPFFLYAVSNDAEDTILFAISRVPHRTVAPAAGNIGKTGSAVASTQGSFFALGDPTVGDYDGNPCTCIGSFRMRMSAADDWTVQALATNDGVGQYNVGTGFVSPAGQNGAAAGKYFADNGGTAPAFTSSDVSYSIALDGFVTIKPIFITGTAGAGAVTALFVLPIAAGTSDRLLGSINTDAAIAGICRLASSLTVSMFSTATILINTDFTAAGALRIDGYYRAGEA